MKKIIFTGLAVLLALSFAACNNEPVAEPELTDVVYSEDGSKITLYLNGGVPVNEKSRALSKELAVMGYDFYEVVFTAVDATSAMRVARTSWEIGQSASVRGVPRVDYGTTIPANPAAASTNTAVIFVGRKTSSTLLGVGVLESVAVGATTTLGGNITDAVTSVTFSVLALDAAAGADGGNTDVPALDVTSAASCYSGLTSMVAGGKRFPVFVVNDDPLVAKATGFTLGPRPQAAFSATDPSHKDDIRFYFGGIRLVGGAPNTGSVVELKYPPRYTSGGTTLELRAAYATATTAAITSTLTVDAVFPTTPIDITVTPGSGTYQKGLISLSFSIPVYAVTKTASPDGNSAIAWNIRPGFGTSWYDLDDGTKGQGGALLVSVGEVPAVIDVVTKF